MNSNKIKKCGVGSCRTCPFLEESNSFYSNSTKKRYFPRTAGLDFLNCKTENLVYLISCKICNFQYVGETKNRLQKRFSGHRNSINKGDSGQMVHKHFQDDGHGISNCSIIPIEKIDERNFNNLNPNEKDRLISRLRLEREKYWISVLQTAYPFGLNCRVKGVGDFLPSQVNFQLFGGRRRRRNKKHSRRKPKRLRTKFEVSLDFVIRKHRELSDKEDYIHFFKTFLYGIPRADLAILKNRVSSINNQGDERVKDLISMVAHQRLFQPVQVSTKKGKDFYHIRFRDKGLDFINIGSIFRNPNVFNNIPLYFSEKEPPIIGYTFNKSIAGKLFNYKESLKEEEIQKFLSNNISCSCSSSPFKDNNHNHVITGNLNIVENIQLRDLIKKGPKFRLPQKIDWKKDRETIVDFLDRYIDKWIEKEKKTSRNHLLRKSCLNTWKESVLGLVDRKIEKGKNRFQRTWSDKIDGNVKRELDRLKDKYVITVTDKAQNNVLFTCKWFYITKVKNELCGPGQNTYLEHIDSLENVNRNIINFSKAKSIKVQENMRDIPLIYWIPKMHKSPIGSRFIAGSKTCSIKPLSKHFSKALKLILNHMKLYSGTVFERASLNYFWIVDNSLEFLERIKCKRLEHMETFDFSTLYTALPHSEIKNKFSKIFQKVFNREGKQFINVNFYKAHFSNTQNKGSCSFRVTDLMETLEFILDNIFVKYGDKIFKQVIGIPIGLDSGQDIANLLLFSYESEYVEKMSKSNMTLARKFNLCSRYIDDLFVGNFPTFREHIYKIYPRELEIKLESNNPKEVAYLDIKVKIEERGLDLSIYDKRDDFNFEIINFPYMSSCIPKKAALGVFYSQLIRYGRICSKLISFKVKAKNLIDKLRNQGYNIEDLRKLSLRFFKERNDIITKFNVANGNDFLKEIL